MAKPQNAPYVFLDDNIQMRSRYYSEPLKIITANELQDITTAFEAIQSALNNGHHVAGYASYELGLLLDKKLAPLFNFQSSKQSPLLCFGVFDQYSDTIKPAPTTRSPLPALKPRWSQTDYTARFERLKAYIQAGDIYQANLTFPYKGHIDAAPDLPYLYQTLQGRQPVRYGGIVSLKTGPDILSLSPELFFKVEDGQIDARPMKGTAPRGATAQLDAMLGADMLADEKSRAENLMIVDLLRNDLSRISDSGSVNVTDLFTLETYPTLHQMTSGITARVRNDVTITDVFKALFPCGSVTGAPKIRAMEIIDALEDGPRGPYCGAIGYFDPDGSSMFNVAIRTLTSQADAGGGYALRYHVGSGVVYDSDGVSEYEECKLKANILTQRITPNYDLRETLLWSPDEGYALFEGHMIRLMKAASELGFCLDIQAVMRALDDCVIGKSKAQRVSLSLSANGIIKTAAIALSVTPDTFKISLSKNALSSQNAELSYKSTHMRAFYNAELKRIKALTDCDEVIFINERGEVCEGSYTNIFAVIDGQLYTPPLTCGLLPGVLRGSLLDAGTVKTRIITIEQLSRASTIYIGNSVRGLREAALSDTLPV